MAKRQTGESPQSFTGGSSSRKRRRKSKRSTEIVGGILETLLKSNESSVGA